MGICEQMSLNKRCQIIRRIAGVNLKKIPGGSSSDMNEIYQFAMADAENIRRQVKLYEPHLIVACGTFWIAERVFNLDKSSRLNMTTGVCHNASQLGPLLDFWHPQAWKSPEYLFNEFALRINEMRYRGIIP